MRAEIIQETALDDLVVRKPHDYESWYNLGVLAHQRKDFQKSCHCFEQALHEGEQKISNQQKKEALYNLGNSYALAEKYDEALKQYEKILEFDSADEKVKEKIEVVQELREKREQQEQDKSNKNDDARQSGEKKSNNSSDNSQKGEQKQQAQQEKSNPAESQNESEQQSKQENKSGNEQTQAAESQASEQDKHEKGDQHEKSAQLDKKNNDNQRIQDIIDKARAQEQADKPENGEEEKLVAYLQAVDDQAQKQLLYRQQKNGVKGAYENQW